MSHLSTIAVYFTGANEFGSCLLTLSAKMCVYVHVCVCVCVCSKLGDEVCDSHMQTVKHLITDAFIEFIHIIFFN